MKKGRRFLFVMVMICLPILSLAIFCGANIAKASTCVVAINGGSIYLTSGANMTMDGSARISGSSGENGGAIYIGDGATLTMTGGIIDSCSATNGGAIYIASGGTFIFNGGTISNCMANLGYAIYIQRGGNIIMTGGSFVNCGEDEGLHIYAEETLVAMYVDDEIKGMVLVGETETLNDIITPLSSGECCGWFLDSKLTEVLDYDASLEELAGNELFINIYTKTATPEKLTFTLDSATDTYIVSKASGSTIRDEVVIPREYNGKTVSAIYEGTSGSTGAFANCRMTSIYLPSTITEISDYSFYSCYSLAEINLHNNMTHIGYEAFNMCSSITSIVIPDSVTSIDTYAFEHCSGLISVTIGETVTSIGSRAFIYCDKINEINYNAINCNDLAMYSEVFSNCGSYDPGIVVNIGNKVERIPAYLFCHNRGSSYPRVKQVIFEENSICASIGDYAFGYCDTLESFYVPASVTSLSYNIFWDCDNIESLVVDENNPVYDSRNNCNAIIETATNTLLRGCVNTVIPNSILIIGERAFYGLDEITQLNIPNGVVSIGERAFYDCSGLTSVEIPNTVKNIGEYAFYDCSGVTVLSIGEGVTTIGSSAFSGLRNLTELNYNAINNVSTDNLTPFTRAGQDASGIVVNFGNKVTKIPANLFCYSIEWSYTPNIVEVKFAENSVCESIGREAFKGCEGLTSITFPESLVSIGNEAFYLCRGLTSITFPESLISIGSQAFLSCSGLTSIEIPRNVSSIGSQAFRSCSGLTSIVVDENNSVYDSRNNCNAIIQTGTIRLISGCLNTVIPDSVTAIYDYAFSGCTGLTSIYIPDSVTFIGEGAFYGCTGLTSIYIPLSVTAISAVMYYFAPFYNCSTDLVIYCGAEEKPSGWATYWNYRTSAETYTTYWGYTREEYEQAISSSTFAHGICNVCYEKSGNIPSLETSFEALSSRLTLNDADVRDIKFSLYETSDNQNNKSYTETSIVLNEKREYLKTLDRK